MLSWQGGHAHVHGKNVQGGRKVMDRLCSRHYRTYQERQRFHDVEILANIRNNFDADSAENVHNQVNNNDNHDMADDPQRPVGVPPDILGAGRQRLLP